MTGLLADREKAITKNNKVVLKGNKDTRDSPSNPSRGQAPGIDVSPQPIDTIPQPL